MKNHICPICGYVHRGDKPPAFCPQCKCSGKKFDVSGNDVSGNEVNELIDDILVKSSYTAKKPSEIVLDEAVLPKPPKLPEPPTSQELPEIPDSPYSPEERRIRHCEKEKLIALLIAQSNPETVAMQIAQTKAKMEKEDVADVMREFEEWRKIR